MKQIIGALIFALMVCGIIFGAWADAQAVKSVRHPATATSQAPLIAATQTPTFLPVPDAQPTAQPTMDYDPARGAREYCDTMQAYCAAYPDGKECADARLDCAGVW